MIIRDNILLNHRKNILISGTNIHAKISSATILNLDKIRMHNFTAKFLEVYSFEMFMAMPRQM